MYFLIFYWPIDISNIFFRSDSVPDLWSTEPGQSTQIPFSGDLIFAGGGRDPSGYDFFSVAEHGFEVIAL